MIQSGGVLRKGPSSTIWQGTPATWPDWLSTRMGSYGAIYRRQLWVAVLVNKIGNATARLPRKTYERNGDGREDARAHPYGQLMLRPSTTVDPFLFWLWTRSTLDIYGEAFWGKIRDRGGRPVELVPLHPTNVRDDTEAGKVRWSYDDGTRRIDRIERRDLVHFQHFNPDSLTRGMSPMEPLRATLENEDYARRANSAAHRNGGKPSVYLTHPRTLSEPAGKRLLASWNDLHGGVDNWAKAALLEEGMTAQTLTFNVEELQYVESRRLNREEACAAYDVPPPVVHILDRATFSNITEQMRSMYRDTMAPKLGQLESTMEMELRDGRMGEGGDPDFGDEVYSEFLMDEVLRGDFEVRTGAMATAIQTGQMTPAEARRMENRPYIDGTDRLFVNSAVAPLTREEEGMSVAELTLALQKIYLSVGTVISADEAREILDRAGANLGPMPAMAPIDQPTVRALMGRLSRQKTVHEVDELALTAGLNGHTPKVLLAVHQSKALDETVEQLRARIAALGTGE